MTVYARGKPVRTFPIAIGFGGLGPKQRQGDGKVPEGRYRITGRNPASAYHLSLRIGYPTPAQLAAARRRGIDPGNDIMIHGLPRRGAIGSGHRLVGWSAGPPAASPSPMRKSNGCGGPCRTGR